jgi:hypothetical protein
MGRDKHQLKTLCMQFTLCLEVESDYRHAIIGKAEMEA